MFTLPDTDTDTKKKKNCTRLCGSVYTTQIEIQHRFHWVLYHFIGLCSVLVSAYNISSVWFGCSYSCFINHYHYLPGHLRTFHSFHILVISRRFYILNPHKFENIKLHFDIDKFNFSVVLTYFVFCSKNNSLLSNSNKNNSRCLMGTNNRTASRYLYFVIRNKYIFMCSLATTTVFILCTTIFHQ